MAKLAGHATAPSFVILCIVGLAACSSGGAGSTFTTGQSGSAGSGGQAGSGGSGPIIGGGAGGSDGGFLPRVCTAEADPPCPAKVQKDNVIVGTVGAAAQFEGVTEIQGSLTIAAIQDLSAFSCLERVSSDVELDFNDEGTMSLYGLRNLKSVGGNLDIYATSKALELRADCALSHLESVGSKNLLGGYVAASAALTGVLDLSRLGVVTHIRLSGTRLTRVALPSNVALTMGQLWFEGNSALSDILGFENVTLHPRNGVTGTYSLRITKNPQLPNCRAEQFQQMFVAAGFDPALMAVSDNALCVR